MQIRSLLLLLLFVVTGLGCAGRVERIVFRNQSDTPLWVNVAGFDYSVPCGALYPGKTATTVCTTVLPAEVTLTWTEEGASAGEEESDRPNRKKFSFKDRPKPGSTLVFEYTAERVWKTRYEPKAD